MESFITCSFLWKCIIMYFWITAHVPFVFTLPCTVYANIPLSYCTQWMQYQKKSLAPYKSSRSHTCIHKELFFNYFLINIFISTYMYIVLYPTNNISTEVFRRESHCRSNSKVYLIQCIVWQSILIDITPKFVYKALRNSTC